MEPKCSPFCRVRVENVSLREDKNDPTIRLHVDREEECMDDVAIIGVYCVSDAAYNSIISQLIRQLVEK